MDQSAQEPVTISRIDARVYRYPIKKPVVTSFGAMTSRPAVFVRIEDTHGGFGWGEIFANWPAAGAEHRARLLMEDVADLVLGVTTHHPSDLFKKLQRETRIRALQCGEWGPFNQVIAGLDIAMYDLFARRAEVPLRTFLNKHAHASVPAYASGIHIRDAEDVIARFRGTGFRAFKVKVGFDTRSDVAQLEDISSGTSAEEQLFADANQAWECDDAIAFMKDVSKFDLGWLEEPIRADASDSDWRRLAAETSVPIAGGENISGYEGFENAIQSGVFSYIQPDVCKWGGITGCFAVAQAIQKGMRTYCPHFLGGGIGLAASAHLLAAVGGTGLLEVDTNPNPLRDAFVQSLPLAASGRWELGSDVGLGVTDIPDDLSPFQTLALHKK